MSRFKSTTSEVSASVHVELRMFLHIIDQRVHRCDRPELRLFQPLNSVFQRLPLIAEPDAHHLTIVVQFLSNFGHLLTGGVSILLEVTVEDFQSLWRERGPPFALFGGLAADKLGQVLHTGAMAGFRLGHPALQHGLNLLGAFWGDVQLLEPGRI